jgi:nematocidal protein AidA
MAKDNELKASAQQVNVLVVIDTDYVKAHYPPNTNQSSPQGIDHNSQFMICTGSRTPPVGQGTADLQFSANVGDFVSFTGTSIYANSDDAVIVYGINYWQGDKVFNGFESDLTTRNGAVMPNPASQPTGLPANQQAITFASYDSRIAKGGLEYFYVYFALYSLDSSGEKQNLYGYFYWDPSVKVA